MTRLTLLSPLAGWAAPLDEVPDPVFAGRMMGEGLAIDPTGGVLRAPAAGVIVKLPATRHAVTLRTDEGAEILVHIGLETVALGGDGFEALVEDGERVAAGQPLIAFDLDRLARRAPSLISPVVVTNPDAFRMRLLRTGCEVAEGEPLLELVTLGAVAPQDAPGEGPQIAPAVAPGIAQANGPAPEATARVRITHPHGLHARPAARLAAEARRWNAAAQLALGDRRAEARSPVAIMTLGAGAGAEISISAQGPDAAAAVAALARLVETLNGEPAPDIAPRPAALAPTGISDALRGVAAAPGLATGPAWRFRAPEAPLAAASTEPAGEARALEAALAAARARLEDRIGRLEGEAREVARAHLALLEDPELMAAARRALADGAGAGPAWRAALEVQVRALERSPDPRIAERAQDLRDLEQQVLWALAGRAPDPPRPPPGAIVMAEDLLPSEVSALAGRGVAALAAARGGPTSHMAILAAALDIPAVVAAGPALLEIADGAAIVVDGDAGVVETAPDAARLATVRAAAAAQAQAAAEARARAAEPCRTAEGTRIEVLANIGSRADAEAAAAHGAEGCGLLRTEFLFLDRAEPPSEAEQAQAYAAIAAALPGRPVTVRTLDVGGDKPAPYLALPREDNPALGLRGVRVSLARRDLLDAQLGAILRAWPDAPCRIMLPMVASAAEVLAVRGRLEALRGTDRAAPVALGIMVETPAAAVTADLLAPHVDFLSIGTNDLAQYALAMDRTHPELAAQADGLHPAVLRLIRLAAAGAAAHGRPVSVCGGLASDPAAVPILLGLGVTALSATPARIPAVKAQVRTLSLDACRELAARACEVDSAQAVRALQPAPARRPARKGA